MNTKITRERILKYPQKEIAVAFIGHAEHPFKKAMIGITMPFPDYNLSRDGKKNPINLFEYVLEGEGEVMVDGKWERVCAGDIYVLRQDEDHMYRSCPESPMKKLWINYIADYTPALLDAYGIKSGIYRSESAKEFFERAYRLVHAVNTESYVYFDISDCVHGIIRAIAIDRLEPDRADIHRIKDALNASVYTKLNLDQLSAKLHISKSNIIRQFKKHYGITPYDYLIGLKMDAAKLLLRNTQMTIREIADRLCISDQHYFSSLFLDRVGVRPRDYRAGAHGTR